MSLDLVLQKSSVHFERDEEEKCIKVSFCNADYNARCATNIVVGYEDGSYETFDGEDIAVGGCHKISFEKAEAIDSVKFEKKGKQQDEDMFFIIGREVGFRLKTVREKKGIKQKELAEQVGVSQSKLSSMERGVGKICTYTVLQITNLLVIGLSDIGQITTQEFDAKFSITRKSKPHPSLATIFNGMPAAPV